MDAENEKNGKVPEEALLALRWIYAIKPQSGGPISLEELIKYKNTDQRFRAFPLNRQELAKSLEFATPCYLDKTPEGKYSLNQNGWSAVGDNGHYRKSFELKRQSMINNYKDKKRIPRNMGETTGL